MLVSEAVGAVLAGLGADTVFGVVGSGNFHVTNALIARGARFVAARHEGGAAVHGRRLGAGDRPARAAVGAPGAGPDQRDDRHHRGGQEPDAAAGAGRGRRRRGGAVQLPHRRGGARRRRSGRWPSGCTPPPRPPPTWPGPTGPRSAPAPHGGARDAAGRPGGAVRPAGDPAGRRRCAPARPAAEAAGRAGRASWPARSGRCSSPAGAPGWRTPGRPGGLADACGALLATSAAAKGLFRGSPWDLDVSGGLRLAARGRADRRAPT